MGLNKYSSFEDMANGEAQDASKKVEETATEVKTVEAKAETETEKTE